MVGPAVPDMPDDNVAAEVFKNSPLTKKVGKADNPYGDDKYCKGSADVLKRLGAGKKYKTPL